MKMQNLMLVKFGEVKRDLQPRKKLTVISCCQTVSTSKTTILERDYRFFAAFLSEIDLDIVDT